MTESEWVQSAKPRAMLEFLSTFSQRGKSSLTQPGFEFLYRKLRLFATACGRAIWGRLCDSRSRYAIETAERLADNLVGLKEVEKARAPLQDACASGGKNSKPCPGCFPGEMLQSYHRLTEVALWISNQCKISEDRQAAFLRDLFGNPFALAQVWTVTRTESGHVYLERKDGRTPDKAVRPPWLTSGVQQLAQTAYTERLQAVPCGVCQDGGVVECPACAGTGCTDMGTLDPANLLILADALEENGCTDTHLLMHLRGWEWFDSGWVKLRGPHVLGCWAVDQALAREA